MAEEQPHAKVAGDFHQITVEDLYDKEKYDLSTMEQQDVMQLLQYVSIYKESLFKVLLTYFTIELNPKV